MTDRMIDGLATRCRLRLGRGVTDIALDECLDETIEDLWALWQSHWGKSTTEPVDDLPQKVGRAQA